MYGVLPVRCWMDCVFWLFSNLICDQNVTKLNACGILN